MAADQTMENEDWLSSRYVAVAAAIRQDVLEGRIRTGDKLDGERKLAERFGVSRETIRGALKVCEDEGLIVRLAARGTFVAPLKVDQDLGEMDTFDSTVRGLQLNPQYELIAVGTVGAEPEVAKILGIGAGDEILRVKVMGMADGLPLAFYESSIPSEVAVRFPEKPDWQTRSSYQIAAAALGESELAVKQKFEAVSIPREFASLLRVSAKAPGFHTVSVFSSGARPIELRQAWYPGGRYSFRVTRTVRFSHPT